MGIANPSLPFDNPMATTSRTDYKKLFLQAEERRSRKQRDGSKLKSGRSRKQRDGSKLKSEKKMPRKKRDRKGSAINERLSQNSCASATVYSPDR